MDKPFSTLEHLVFGHISQVSGCVCILQQWDETRRRFIEKLKLVNVPVTVLIVVRPGGGISGAGGQLLKAEGSLHVLEAGNIEAGLAKLK
jgi:hypothetical protein